MNLREIRLCIIGLGYVGLPLAVEFGKKRKTIGFDINKQRIIELQNGYDITKEKNINELSLAKKLKFTNLIRDLEKCNCFIITVPTPINKEKKPDLEPLRKATVQVGKLLKKEDLVIYESTVYPGCTEEFCVPILENISNLKFNKDFYCGYSPERINPGDKKHSISEITKVTSGSNKEVSELVDKLYKQIIPAGTHKAKSIKIAEAAKIIENTQRDLNIALINEFAILFNKLGIDTQAVLEAAETKWNFNSYRPGLVGGHCISIDPYYLTFKAEEIGYKPEIILSGRKINDNMSNYVCEKLVEEFKKRELNLQNQKILIMGLSFKENCNDLRNTQVINIYKILKKQQFKIDIFDPIANSKEAEKLYGIKLINEPKNKYYNAVIIAVAHDIFKKMGIIGIKKYCADDAIIYDLKYLLSKEDSDIRL